MVYICEYAFICIYFLPRFDIMCTILVPKIMASYELTKLSCISCSCADGGVRKKEKENEAGGRRRRSH